MALPFQPAFDHSDTSPIQKTFKKHAKTAPQ
jgi:hypothetical protein